jgi:N-acetylmuramoyl-L-alanine amidase
VSPVLTERSSDEYYDAIARTGVDPLFLLAMFTKESSMGRAGFAAKTHSWGNTRPPSFGVQEAGDYNQDTGTYYPRAAVSRPSGRYLSAYASWLDGAVSTASRLVAPDFVYVKEGRKTIEQVIERWAPPVENATSAYLDFVVGFMDTHAEEGVTDVVAKTIILAAGHHQQDDNKNGVIVSNPDEYKFTGQVTHEIAEALRAYPQFFNVVVLTPGDGTGVYPGGIWDVARAACKIPNGDMFIELHSQGVGNRQVRGAFVVYPDNPGSGDFDQDAINFAHYLLPAITQNVGVPTYGDGILSEMRTQVGIDGYRLGIFNLSASCRDRLTRVLVENLTHSNPVELQMSRDPKVLRGYGQAYAQALAAYYGFHLDTPTPVPPGQAPGSVRAYIDDNGHGHVDIDFGGDFTEIDGYTVGDVGIDGFNREGTKYHRSVYTNGFADFIVTGRK